MSFFSKLSGKKVKDIDDRLIEGVVTFFGAHHALKGEKILSSNGIRVKLIPGPREISPNCGTALRFDYSKADEAGALLSENNILFEQIHHYPAK